MEMIVDHRQCFYFEGFKLTATHASHLVEIHKIDERVDPLNQIEDLPDWVFDSRVAVWLTERSASIYDRSSARQIILQLLQPSSQISSRR
jgi:hypothetical protein